MPCDILTWLLIRTFHMQAGIQVPSIVSPARLVRDEGEKSNRSMALCLRAAAAEAASNQSKEDTALHIEWPLAGQPSKSHGQEILSSNLPD